MRLYTPFPGKAFTFKMLLVFFLISKASCVHLCSLIILIPIPPMCSLYPLRNNSNMLEEEKKNNSKNAKTFNNR